MFYLVTRKELDTIGALRREAGEALAFFTSCTSFAIAFGLAALAAKDRWVDLLSMSTGASLVMAAFFLLRWRAARREVAADIKEIVESSQSPAEPKPADGAEMTWGQLVTDFIAAMARAERERTGRLPEAPRDECAS